jgi:hypothetical protein
MLLLGAFDQSQKASICLSVRMEQAIILVSHYSNFKFLEKFPKKIHTYQMLHYSIFHIILHITQK